MCIRDRSTGEEIFQASSEKMSGRTSKVRALGYSFHNVNRMIIGTGNWFFPKSRLSIGIHALDLMAKRHSLQWGFVPAICSDVVALQNVIFVRPRNYVDITLGRIVRETIEDLGLDYERDLTILHYDTSMTVGEHQQQTGVIPMSSNDGLMSIFTALDDVDINRVAIGVGKQNLKNHIQPFVHHTLQNELRLFVEPREIFLAAMMDKYDQQLADEAATKVTEEILAGVGLHSVAKSRLNAL
eukprot:TRINITY_DN9524_c0_g1_i1.p1 TRINITY_DN9524_c0_g1~~TRINITY_DN9524_c0_g1_i1.p1  ORF type:complete len:241 (+),score=22.63 TRINITY_DN9524_c0_g1_i1:29-751(+)